MNAVTMDDQYGLLVSGTHNQKVRIYDVANGGLKDEIEVFLGEGPVNSIRVAHQEGFDGVSFVGCYSGAIVRVTREGKIDGKFRVHENAVKALRIHPHKSVGVSCSADGILVSWDLEGKLLNRFLGHMAIIDDVDIDPTGKYIASVGRDFTLKVYSIDEARLLHSIALGHRSPKALCFWDENTVVVTNYWGELIRVSLPEERILCRQIAQNGISSIARSGSHLVAVSYDGRACLVRPDDLTVVNTLRAMTQRVEKSLHA
jgi:WD40 repeat protein